MNSGPGFHHQVLAFGLSQGRREWRASGVLQRAVVGLSSEFKADSCPGQATP